MSMVAVAIGASAVIGAGSSMMAANSAAKAQKGANAANAANAKADREFNLDMFERSRGRDGSALLPLYFGEGEKALGQDALAFSQALRDSAGTASDQLGQARSLANSYNDIAISGDDLLRQLYSGGMLNQRLAAFSPLAAAREAKATGQASSFDQALAEVTNRMEAENMRRGFTGGSSFANQRLLDSTFGARRASSDVMADARVGNATDRFGLSEEDLQTRMNMLDYPFSRAKSRLEMLSLPQDMLAQSFSRTMQPLDFFRMQPEAFRGDPTPMQQPVMGSGQIAGTAFAAGANTIGNYFTNKALMKQIQGFGTGSQIPDVNFGISPGGIG